MAVRLLSQAEVDQDPEWLQSVRRPGKGMPDKVLICQAMAMVRLYSWQVLVTSESVECPTGLLTMGWVEMSPEYLRGEIPVSPFNQTNEARGRRMETVTCMPAGTVAAMAAAPLGESPFEPQAVVIYCTPGQAMRLVQSTLFEEGRSHRVVFRRCAGMFPVFEPGDIERPTALHPARQRRPDLRARGGPPDGFFSAL